MKLRNLIVAFTIFLSYPAKAQDQHVIDSLNQALQTSKHDTDKINCLFALEEALIRSNPDTVLVLGSQVMRLVEQNLSREENHPLKVKYLTYLAEAWNNSGFIYKRQGDIDKALQYYHRSLKFLEEIDHKAGIAASLNNLGTIYQYQGDIDKALEFFHASIRLKEEVGDQVGMAFALNNVGVVYQNQGNTKKGLEYFDKSINVYERLEDKSGIAAPLNNIGAGHKAIGNYVQSLEYYQRSLKVAEEYGHKEGMSTSLINIGNLYFNLNDLDKAIEYATQSMQLANELQYPENMRDAASLFAKAYRIQGNYKEALEMYELHIQMRDSIKNEETQKATIRQQTKYEFEKAQLVQEQEEKEAARIVAEEISRRDNLQYSVILISLLVLGAGVMALGRISVSPRVAEGLIFFSFLILFEFLLVLADPTIETWSGGAPGIKLLFNAGIAALIFPAHAFFESRLKKRLVKAKN